MQTAGPSQPDLPAIPSKRYFTIGEVATLCDVKAHVLRYWEQEFDQIKPVKRNNRRYYQQQDVLIIRQIKSLLHDQGYTISGAKQWLVGDQSVDESARYKQLLKQTISELEEILKTLKSGR
ncbi:MerR family transcriptional regulator [Neptunomonas concharum]|jgi:DNA-binding transcriptional MerR regulator|uniref:MerR family transcriptional regulator n=1 Tax=Neptunomonas concharum TaxID=1031538 RepID=A0A5P1RDJ3_9GAMM|nr:MerR family transcriptional regulator [Neptunomonas concharum]QEQ97326.1 MerR family transcriptional regulator [Neptunomonas concharum]